MGREPLMEGGCVCSGACRRLLGRRVGNTDRGDVSSDLRLYCCSKAAGRKILKMRVIRRVPTDYTPPQPGPLSSRGQRFPHVCERVRAPRTGG